MDKSMRVVGVVAGLVAAAILAGCVSNEVESEERSDSDAARYNTQLGANYLQRGDLELAREKLEKAVVQDPNLVTTCKQGLDEM